MTSDERARLKELERENRELRRANEILKSASLCVGYLLASIGPFLLGAAHDSTGHWTVPLLLLMAITLAEAVGLPATRPWQDSGDRPGT